MIPAAASRPGSRPGWSRSLVLALALAAGVGAAPAPRPRFEPLVLELLPEASPPEGGALREVAVRCTARVPIRGLRLEAFATAGVVLLGPCTTVVPRLLPGQPLTWRVRARLLEAGPGDRGVAVEVSYPAPEPEADAVVGGPPGAREASLGSARARQEAGARRREFLAVALPGGR